VAVNETTPPTVVGALALGGIVNWMLSGVSAEVFSSSDPEGCVLE
jgi:hypothetical protein